MTSRTVLLSLLQVVLFGASAGAVDRVLILSGSSFEQDMVDSKQIYETEKAKGNRVFMVAQDGTWPFGIKYDHAKKNEEEAELIPAYTVDHVEFGLRNIARGMKAGERLTIIISDHGNSAFVGSAPIETGLFLNHRSKSTPGKPPFVRHSLLLKLINRHVPAENQIRFIVNHCYGGGVHHISYQRKNTCSAALTNPFEPNYVDFGIFKSLWNHRAQFDAKADLDQDGKLSFMESFLYSRYLGNARNAGRENISSFDYVEFVLKKGTYDPKITLTTVSELPLIVDVLATVYQSFSFVRKFTKLGLEKTYGYMIEKDGKPLIDAKRKEEFKASIQKLAADGKIPKSGEQTFLRYLGVLEKNQDGWLKEFASFQTEYLALKKSFTDLSASERGRQYEEYFQKFEAQQKHFEPKIAPYLMTLKVLEHFQLLPEFMQKATAEQLAKYKELVECEIESI